MKYPLTEEEIYSSRPKPFYFITTNDPNELSEEAMTEKLTELKNAGFGGIVLFNKPQNGFDAESYLSDRWFEMVEATAKACRMLSLVMWINDGFDFPPGDVAGRIQKVAPELKQRRIALVDGIPTVQEVEWGFPAFEEKRSTELFIELVYEAYKAKVGKYFGDPIVGFFSDSDNRRVKPSVMFDGKSPMLDYFPWSSDFEDSFQSAYGYEIMPYMTDVLLRKDIPQSADYWEHAGRLYQGWFKAHHEWCEKNGLLYAGHTSDSSPYLYEEAPRCSCFTEGRFSDMQRNFDYAGTDQELYALDGGKHMLRERYYTPKVVWGEKETMPKMQDFSLVSIDLRAKQAAATAFVYGKKGVMCEMFAATNFGVEPSTLKRIAAYQIMQGVTFVVPHAYHHRFRGETKFFAPPDYSKSSMLKYSIRELNDEIASLTAMMTKGESVYPIALVDPTEYVWRGVYDSSAYFEAFGALNRLPYGFTIADTDKILNGDYGFRVAIAAGITLSEELKEKIRGKGIVLLETVDLARLKAVLSDCEVTYQGGGTPHFTRKVIDGEEFAFIANVENDEPIEGEIFAYGRRKQIKLYPGDVRYISKTYDDIPQRTGAGTRLTDLATTSFVKFDKPNVLPLEWFKSGKRTVLKTGDEAVLDLPFFVAEKVEGVKLFVPQDCFEIVTAVALNGEMLFPNERDYSDEPYVVFELPDLEKGKHELTIGKTGKIEYYHRIFLSGEFDVEIETDKTEYLKVYDLYNLQTYIPKKANITLSPRRQVLRTDLSWAEQGQPFYSGGCTYSFEVDGKREGNYTLVLPAVRDVADVCINGSSAVRKIKPPYEYEVLLKKGKNQIEITVYNSLANEMECYLEQSGLLAIGYILDCSH